MKNALVGMGMAIFVLGCGITSAQPVTGNVAAVPLWTDTGIYLTNGEWVNVNANGFWQWTFVGAYIPVTNDPDGTLDFNTDDLWLFNNIHASLLAFVGADPKQGSQWEPNGVFQTNQYWEMGTAGQFMSNTNGELWLGINDDAFQGPTNDNDGSIVASVSVGFSSYNPYENLALSIVNVSSNQFSFSISNGVPFTACAIYDSADLTHWTLVNATNLDQNGACNSFANNTAVPYRFYKVSDAQFWSRTIGFVRIPIGPNYTNMIANQLDNPYGNTLDGLFNIGSDHTMIDGTSVPIGVQILKWNGSGFDYYTWGGTSWSPNGSATLNPGEGPLIINPTTNTFTITFAGLVREGQLSVPLPAGYDNFVSSIVPQAGGIQSVLGYNPQLWDLFYFWSNGAYTGVFYDPSSLDPDGGSPTGWEDWNYNPIPEPVIKVGESFIIQPSSTNSETWIRDFKACPCN